MTRIIESVTSTNSFLIEELSTGNRPLEGDLLFAKFQTGGRGQRGNSWESNKGENILCSLLFIQLRSARLISLWLHWLFRLVSLIIADIIPSLPLGIKWPNDIYVGEKKLGGVLIENSLMGSGIDYSVIGFGINVNQTLFLSGAPNPVVFGSINR